MNGKNILPTNCLIAASLFAKETELRQRASAADLSSALAIGASIAAVELQLVRHSHEALCEVCQRAEMAHIPGQLRMTALAEVCL